MFQYNYLRDLVTRLVEANNYPLQVELHPGAHCGPFHCSYCYGKEQVLCNGSLTLDEYSALLDDFLSNSRVLPFIEISGIASDPLSYPDFAGLVNLIKERGFHFGIHTKGFFLNNELMEVLNKEPTAGNYITISIDSAYAEVYNHMHGISSTDREVYDLIKEKVSMFYSQKLKKDSRLRINLTYLLFRSNSKDEHIWKFIKTFKESADVLRFSIPQTPNIGKPVDFLSTNKVAYIFQKLGRLENDKIQILNFKKSVRDENFETCWAQRFNATIDKAGNVFPCPQVALKEYLNLSWGNIKKQSFFDIWGSEKRKAMRNCSIQTMKCRVCDRKDEMINSDLNKLLSIDRFILNKKIGRTRKTPTNNNHTSL